MRVCLVSLGCDKNLVDSEYMLGLLRDAGYEFTQDEAEAEIILINSCCFIGDAKEESIAAILRAAKRKEEGILRFLVVTGCLAQRYREEILTEIPEVDAVVGTSDWDRIAEVLDGLVSGNKAAPVCCIGEPVRLPLPETERILSTGGYYAYLKIAEGCGKHCAYCVIPKVRGPYRSVPEEKLVREAEELAERGVREIILVAQETTLYGTDLTGKKRLPELIRKLAAIEDLLWIRLTYCYPEEINDELIDLMAEEPKLCHYLDLPVQSGSDTVLRRMGRRTNAAEIRALVARIREKIPDVCLRTTLISGFPGETDAEHAETLAFVREMRFDRLGVFPYSREEDTAAYSMKPQIPKRVKMKRRGEIMKAQQEIAFEKAESLIGCRLSVIVEGQIPEDGVTVCRTYRDAPEVDGLLFVPEERTRMSGDLLTVTVTGARGYDLIGEADDESAE